MAPIRVAIAGLSASSSSSWAASSHLAYLRSPQGQKHYEIVALLNSSKTAAENAKKEFNLPNVKTYGDPDALAADPDVDLVVVATRADVHYPNAKPSIRAGKAAFVEWPLTHDLASSLDLIKDLPQPSNTVMSLQGRVAPFILRLKEILASGTIGKVLSSEARIHANLYPRDGFPDAASSFLSRKIGGHATNIYLGHSIDFIHEVLGSWETFDSKMQLQRPERKLLYQDGRPPKTVQSEVPDLVSLHGTLKNDKGVVAPGATLSAIFRVGPSFPGTPGLAWIIHGEKGDLRLTADGPTIHAGLTMDGPVKIEHHDFASDEVRDLGWDWPESQKQLPLTARSVSELYERYAEWVEGGKGPVDSSRSWPRLEDGVKLMEEFDFMYKQYDPNWYG
ncbi:hypothetical protein NX059_002877 [Plenodomus lindquistii]|nr:hypothetical protein NX059_002877 [Plenodomus lindquistii]